MDGICIINLLLYTQYVKNSYKTLLKALPVFVCGIVIATILNEIAAASGILENETFNMFYISPYYDCTLPVLSGVYASVPYPVFLIVYLLGFAAISALVFGIEKGILMLTMKSKKDI